MKDFFSLVSTTSGVSTFCALVPRIIVFSPYLAFVGLKTSGTFTKSILVGSTLVVSEVGQSD